MKRSGDATLNRYSPGRLEPYEIQRVQALRSKGWSWSQISDEIGRLWQLCRDACERQSEPKAWGDKIAASRIGVTVEVYREHRGRGEQWCPRKGGHWVNVRDAEGVDHRFRGYCNECKTDYERAKSARRRAERAARRGET